MSIELRVDEARKMIINKIDGNLSFQEFLKYKDDYFKTVKEIEQENYSLLNSAGDAKVFSAEVTGILKEIQIDMKKFRKVATIVSSVLFETQMKKCGNESGVGDNRRFFKSEEEAIKWLME